MTSSILFFSSCLSHIFPLPLSYTTPSPRFSIKFYTATQKTISEGYRVHSEGFSALTCNHTTFLGETALTSGVFTYVFRHLSMCSYKYIFFKISECNTNWFVFIVVQHCKGSYFTYDASSSCVNTYKTHLFLFNSSIILVYLNLLTICS